MDEFKSIMTEWLSLKHQLAAARKDMTVLNKREKELRAQVQEHMKEMKETQDVDTVKVNQEKVSLHTKESRGSITKNVILAGLRAYFGGDVAAPVFSQTVQQTLRMMGIQPDVAVRPQVMAKAEAESF